MACTGGASATIDLGNGGNFTVGSRRMSNGLSFLYYSLYRDSARTQLWGSGIAGGTMLTYNSTGKAATDITVYGAVPQGQDVTVGSYRTC